MPNLFTPERLEGEDFEQYKMRRLAAKLAARQLTKKPLLPTRFVQHFNPIKNPNPKGGK